MAVAMGQFSQWPLMVVLQKKNLNDLKKHDI